MKRIFLQGLVAGILAATAGVAYYAIYQHTLEPDFKNVIRPVNIIVSSLAGTMLISCGHYLLLKFNRLNWLGYFNVVVALLSFASIIGPVSISLPLDVATPELFPGLAVPMHFFPALAYFMISPFFKSSARKTSFE